MKGYISAFIITLLLALLAPCVQAAALKSATATLSNPRLSYIAGVSTNYSAGATSIAISNAGNPDNTTAHLFPNDVVGIGKSTIQNPNLRVGNITDNVTFTLQDALVNGITNTDKVFATQSGTLTISFITTGDIPVGGSIRVEIPAATGTVSGSANDGIPDTAAGGSSGFDFNNMTSANIVCPGGFTVGLITPSISGGNHVVTCNLSGGPLVGGAVLAVTIGNPNVVGGKGLVNPGPNTIHTQGQADIYDINTYTYGGINGTGSLVDEVIVRAAPMEGVFVSASIDETLSFVVAAVTSGNINSTCFGGAGAPAGNLVTSTATTIPFGPSILANTFYNAAQKITVLTNAPGGYSVKVEENDQMGKDGKVCAGSAAGEAINCIKDTTCNGGTCTESTSADWSTNTNSGLGYTLTNVSPASDAAFVYNESSRTFSAKQFPDMEANETKQVIMSNTGIVNGNSECIIYRLAVSGTQPAGFYFNKVKYTASATF